MHMRTLIPRFALGNSTSVVDDDSDDMLEDKADVDVVGTGSVAVKCKGSVVVVNQ